MKCWLVMCMGLAACSGPTPRPEITPPTSSPDFPSADAVRFAALFDGAAPAAETLKAIERDQGWPVDLGEGRFGFACLCGEGEWSLVGDFNEWVSEPMFSDGELSILTAVVTEPDGLKYKFNRGNEFVADPNARRFGWDEYGEFSLVRSDAAHLQRFRDVGSEAVLPRDISVWVPANGEFTHAIYAHDGQNLFDRQAMWGGWRLDESLPPNTLVVGIHNSPDRIAEYTHVTDVINGTSVGGNAPAYADFVHEVVRPRVQSTYGPAARTAVMGSSLGGLVSLWMTVDRPDDYDAAISLSGTVGWGSIGLSKPTISDLILGAEGLDTAYFIDSGGNGTCVDSDGDGVEDDGADGFDNYCVNAQLYRELSAQGVDVTYHWEPDAPHNEAAWAARVFRPLNWFYTD